MIKYQNSDGFHLKFYDKYISVLTTRPLRIYANHELYDADIYTDIYIEPDATTALLMESCIPGLYLMSYIIVNKQKIVLQFAERYSTLVPFWDIQPGNEIVRIVPVSLAYPKIEFQSTTKTSP